MTKLITLLTIVGLIVVAVSPAAYTYAALV
jgi:hypothetical protein